jgi:hypothetical protein
MIGQDMDARSQKLLMVNTDTKCIGYDNSDTNRKAISGQFNMKSSDLETAKRTFWVKVANGTPFKVKTRSTLAGHNNAMNPLQWEDVKQYQAKYYRKPPDPHKGTGNTPPPPEDDTTPPPRNDKYKSKFNL